MTPLVKILHAQIAAAGPISIADYMALCLGHPEHGYYVTRDPLGAAGDFITAPEISQMFGEMIGLWLAAVWRDAGRPAPFRLVELGPGRGTLMVDALRAAAAVPGFRAAADLWLVEASLALRAEQTRRLPDASWTGSLTEVPEGPLLLVANEFFDALPMRQYLGTPEGWREAQVGLRAGRLVRGLSAPIPGEAPARPGDWREESPALHAIAGEIGRRIAAQGGAALITDYGYRAEARPAGPTLQALRAHARVDPLERPGEADLTWLIDFDALGGALAPLACHHATQGAFLVALGIGHRAAALAQARPGEAEAIADALERLTAPDQMGRLFRVLAATAPGAPAPPGFGPADPRREGDEA